MPVGKTKSAGWQVGVSTTVPYDHAEVWEALAEPDGLAVWLGGDVTLAGQKGEEYHTSSGVSGEVRSFRPNDRIRLTWRPSDWSHDTTVQVAVEAKAGATTIRFHQERLASAAERERQRRHWKTVADDVTDFLHRSLG